MVGKTDLASIPLARRGNSYQVAVFKGFWVGAGVFC
jgi:hypothetical protein